MQFLLSSLLKRPAPKPATDQDVHRRNLGKTTIFSFLPTAVKAAAIRLEVHITEGMAGVPADASPGTRPRRDYDVTC